MLHDIDRRSGDVITADPEVDRSFGPNVVPASLLVSEKEEAKAVLTLFLKKQGLSNTSAARIINKSESFVGHLISRLHSVHKSRYLVGSIATVCSFMDPHC